MKRTKNRFIVLFTGIIVCLITLEVSLRIVGSIYAHLSESESGKKSIGEMTILSIGDSVTYGIGASKDLSYPAQLEKLLNEGQTKSKYTVINRGRPGQNSAQLLTRIESQLQEFQPDIVTILIGAQNQSNYYGYRQFLEKSYNKQPSLFLQLHESLDRIRIYKFFRLLLKENIKTIQFTTPISSIHKQNTEADEYFSSAKLSGVSSPECVKASNHAMKGEYEQALESIPGVVENKKVELECHHLVGAIYRWRKQYDEALIWFKEGIKQDPTQFRNYEGIGWSYYEQNQIKEAIYWFKKGFEATRYDALYELCYVGIAAAFFELGEQHAAIDFFKKEIKRQPLVDDHLHTLAGDFLSMFQSSRTNTAILNWIESDIEKIFKLCNKYNAQPILQNYPYEPFIGFIYEKIAQNHNIPFVDQQASFVEFISENGERNQECFVPDGHPNARGYHLMAENILTILKAKEL